MTPNKLFGTDGIRGKANRYPMTPAMALVLGEAIASHFAKKKGKGRILIGKDTRRSSYMFEYALCAGISSMGSLAMLTGPIPTPAVAYLTQTMRADAGVMISASHNAYYDNGIKFFDSHGFKLNDEIERSMEDFVFATHDDSLRPINGDIGRAIRLDDASGRYVTYLKSTFPKELDLKGVKIVLDCAHGAGYKVAPLVLTELGAEVKVIGAEPNGTNINEKCGALHPESMCEMVKKTKAHLGIAIDGDGDRLILCDEQGNLIDGDLVLALSALERKREGKLAKDTVVGTVLSNMGLEVFLKENGIQFLRTSVGDRFIVNEMRKGGYSLGGEPSGHLIFLDLSTTGDGVLAALQVLALMIQLGQPLSELSRVMSIYPQVSKNIPVTNRRDLDSIKGIQKEIKTVEKELHGKGRVIIRYSGTEPLLRVMVEGENEDNLALYADRLVNCISSHLRA